MTLTIDTVNAHGLSNEACCELLPKKTKTLAVHLLLKGIYWLYNANKTEHFSFKIGRVMQVAELTVRISALYYIQKVLSLK